MIELKCANHGTLRITDTVYADGQLWCKKCDWMVLGSVFIDLSTGELVRIRSSALDQNLPEKLGIKFDIKSSKS